MEIETKYGNFSKSSSIKTTSDVKYNPNGSYLSIEGLTPKNGKIFGRMGHSERMQKNLYKNIGEIEEQTIFKAGLDYFK